MHVPLMGEPTLSGSPEICCRSRPGLNCYVIIDFRSPGRYIARRGCAHRSLENVEATSHENYCGNLPQRRRTCIVMARVERKWRTPGCESCFPKYGISEGTKGRERRSIWKDSGTGWIQIWKKNLVVIIIVVLDRCIGSVGEIFENRLNLFRII